MHTQPSECGIRLHLGTLFVFLSLIAGLKVMQMMEKCLMTGCGIPETARDLGPKTRLKQLRIRIKQLKTRIKELRVI